MAHDADVAPSAWWPVVAGTLTTPSTHSLVAGSAASNSKKPSTQSHVSLSTPDAESAGHATQSSSLSPSPGLNSPSGQYR